jgi:hypothetical protein
MYARAGRPVASKFLREIAELGELSRFKVNSKRRLKFGDCLAPFTSGTRRGD